jgi:glycosyltransferase involved in cell wall biosynthesis
VGDLDDARSPRAPARALRIAIASSGLGHVTRGIEAWAADLGRALHERGEDVLLFKGGGRPEFEYERVLPCCQRDRRLTQRLARWAPRGMWRVGLDSPYRIEQVSFALNLCRELRSRRIDVLHVQDPQVAVYAQWARGLGLIRTKTILAHGTSESPEFLQRMRFLQHLAPWHLEQVKAAGAWRSEWTAIPNFIDTTVFHPGRDDELRQELRIPGDHLVVLTAAAIKRDHKRVDHLITEFARFLALRPETKATLIVAGGYEAETDEVMKLGHELLGDRVRFLVRFPRHRMPALYRTADVFVLCSLFEMMPIAVLEALASGLPCLTHQHPILEWMVGPGGRALDMARPGALATELAHFSAHPEERRAHGEMAQRHSTELFGTQHVVERLVRYYDFVHRQPSRHRVPTRARLAAPATP